MFIEKIWILIHMIILTSGLPWEILYNTTFVIYLKRNAAKENNFPMFVILNENTIQKKKTLV